MSHDLTPFGYYGYHHYLYDDPGKTMTIQDWVAAAYNRSFVFDDLNRLVSSTSGSGLWTTAQCRYDAMGNMLTQSIGASGSPGARQTALGKVSRRPHTDNGAAFRASHLPPCWPRRS